MKSPRRQPVFDIRLTPPTTSIPPRWRPLGAGPRASTSMRRSSPSRSPGRRTGQCLLTREGRRRARRAALGSLSSWCAVIIVVRHTERTLTLPFQTGLMPDPSALHRFSNSIIALRLAQKTSTSATVYPGVHRRALMISVLPYLLTGLKIRLPPTARSLYCLPLQNMHPRCPPSSMA